MPQSESALRARGESEFIYGIHDRGGAHVLEGKGWVVQTEELGRDPNNWGSASYADLINQGLGIIVRLNHGYGPNGTIPVVERYEDFAKRCSNFVENSEGCHIWVIGNEPNLGCERPQWQPIRATMYANCYRLCRREIRRRPGHENDQVIVAAIGPWNVETGPWIDYFRDVLWELNVNSVHGFQVDGIAIHTYSRSPWPHDVVTDARMDPPFSHLHSGFRTYQDFMAAIPAWAKSLPVYVTEVNQNNPWRNENTGWVQEAYGDIDRWNHGAGHQQIRCLVLYRWMRYDQWHIDGIGGVIDDLKVALTHGYKWGARPPAPDPVEPEPLPNDETAIDVPTLAEKTRWWLEELIRQLEAGKLERARDIRYSLVELMSRLEQAAKA